MGKQSINHRCTVLVFVAIAIIASMLSDAYPLKNKETVPNINYDVNLPQNKYPWHCKPSKDYKCGLPEVLNDELRVPLNPGITGQIFSSKSKVEPEKVNDDTTK